MIQMIFAVICFASCATFPSTPHATVDPPVPVVEVTGMMGDDTVTNLVHSLLNVKTELRIIIDSPGGQTTAGNQIFNILQAMRARGVNVRCLVTGRAASAAFWVLQACTERLAMSEAKLMIHEPFALLVAPNPVALRIRDLFKIMQQLLEDLQQMSDGIAPRLGMTDEGFKTKVAQGDWQMDVPSALAAHALDNAWWDSVEVFRKQQPVASQATK